MDPMRQRQQDLFLQNIRLLLCRGVGTDGEDVEVGGGVEVVVAEFGPPGEGGPDGEGCVGGRGKGEEDCRGGGGEEMEERGGEEVARVHYTSCGDGWARRKVEGAGKGRVGPSGLHTLRDPAINAKESDRCRRGRKRAPVLLSSSSV